MVVVVESTGELAKTSNNATSSVVDSDSAFVNRGMWHVATQDSLYQLHITGIGRV